MATDEVRELYFTQLHAISMTAHSIVQAYADQYRKVWGMTEMLHAREGKGIMRAFLTQLIYRVLGGQRNISSACALQEVSNIYEYTLNAVLDNKNGIASNARLVNRNVICASLYREIMEDIIYGLQCKEESKLQIMRLSSKAMEKCSVGQAMDLELTIARLRGFASLKSYESFYLEKSRLQSGCIYSFSAEVGAILANAAMPQINLARKIGEVLGTGLHISNDFGDCVSITEGTGFKVYQDQFADLKNGRLSLPIFYVLKFGTSEQQSLLHKIAQKGTASRTEMLEVSKAVVESGTLSYGQKLFRRYEREAKHLIHQLPDCYDRKLLSHMASIIRSNKYLRALKGVNR